VNKLSANNFDVIIIGGGAAGLSSALWCAELGLKALLLEKEAELGGQLLWTYNSIKNHLGVEAASGREMRDIFVRQAENYKFHVRLNAEISKLDVVKKTLLLESGETISARVLIFATGVRRRKLHVEGEEEFKNRGIIESGRGKAHLAKGKNALIIGGGDAALENALILSETALTVMLAHRRTDFKARTEFLEKARANPKITILTDTTAKKIIGNEKVEAVEIKNNITNKTLILPAEIILIRIGVEPNIDILRGAIDLDEKGYININRDCETNAKNVFAVGDVANSLAPTISSAVGMGATAAKVISFRLQR
jgi:thioredoxin reductase (NADPH)